jgi:hypothetical protein
MQQAVTRTHADGAAVVTWLSRTFDHPHITRVTPV